MVYQSLLSKFKKPIAYATASTGFLIALTNKAFAKESLPLKDGIITKIIKDNNSFNGFFGIWGTIGHSLLHAYQILNNINQIINHWTVEVFSYMYKFLTDYILCTPAFIFENAAVNGQIITMSLVSMGIMSILPMIKGLKRIVNPIWQNLMGKKITKSNDQSMSELMKRYAFVVAGSGFAPFAFKWGFEGINKIIHFLGDIGFNSFNHFSLFNNISGFLGGIDTLLMILFDIIVLVLLIPISLQTGRRFFDLMTLTSITPLSLTAWIFDEHRHLYDKWWRRVKELAQAQLVMAYYILIMGLFIFGVGALPGKNIFAAVIIIIGGLWRMIDPPSFVRSKTAIYSENDSIVDNINKGKDIFDTLTLKNVKSLNFAKSKIRKHRKSKAEKLLALRRKHGKRYVGNI